MIIAPIHLWPPGTSTSCDVMLVPVVLCERARERMEHAANTSAAANGKAAVKSLPANGPSKGSRRGGA
jgi:hypothetical protein